MSDEDRPAWIPEYITDKDVPWFTDTLEGRLAYVDHEARRLGIPGMTAQVDQVRAHVRERLIEALSP